MVGLITMVFRNSIKSTVDAPQHPLIPRGRLHSTEPGLRRPAWSCARAPAVGTRMSDGPAPSSTPVLPASRQRPAQHTQQYTQQYAVAQHAQ